MESWAKKLLSDRVLVPSTLTTRTLVAEYAGSSRLVWGLMLVGLFMAGLSGFLCFAIVVRLWSERLVWTSPLTLFGLPAFAALFFVSTYHSVSLLLEPRRWARLHVDEQQVTLTVRAWKREAERVWPRASLVGGVGGIDRPRFGEPSGLIWIIWLELCDGPEIVRVRVHRSQDGDAWAKLMTQLDELTEMRAAVPKGLGGKRGNGGELAEES